MCSVVEDASSANSANSANSAYTLGTAQRVDFAISTNPSNTKDLMTAIDEIAKDPAALLAALIEDDVVYANTQLQVSTAEESGPPPPPPPSPLAPPEGGDGDKKNTAVIIAGTVGGVVVLAALVYAAVALKYLPIPSR